jgi:hypothetical protein
MSRMVRDLARRLTAAGIGESALAATVNELAAARAQAINSEGLQAQIAHLLEAYGPDEIEAIALGNSPAEKQP